MGEAYGFAVGQAPPPDEWLLLGYLDRFGAEAVFGRQVRPEEMRKMILVENVISWYRESKQADNLGEWVRRNRNKFETLKEAAELWQMQK